MKKPIKYTDESMEFTIIAENLPSPDEIAQRLKKEKVKEDQDKP